MNSKFINYKIFIFIVIVIIIYIWYKFQDYNKKNNIEKFKNKKLFPIDAVITWVDGYDHEWQKERMKYKKITNEHNLWNMSNSNIRFNDNNELYYCISSIIKYLPWINKIYLVTMYPQKPKYINKFSKKLQIIYHHQIYNDKSVLPIFNSQSIETQIHNIPGLSEHFIYLNDDTFICKPLHRDFFFTKTGDIIFYKRKLINKYNKNIHNLLIKNKFPILKSFPLHQAIPLRKSYFKKAWEIYPFELYNTSRQKFRELDGIWIIGLIYQLCNVMGEKCYYINIDPNEQLYILLLKSDSYKCVERDIFIKKKIEQYKKYNPSLLCINNVNSDNNYHKDVFSKFIKIFKSRLEN